MSTKNSLEHTNTHKGMDSRNNGRDRNHQHSPDPVNTEGIQVSRRGNTLNHTLTAAPSNVLSAAETVHAWLMEETNLFPSRQKGVHATTICCWELTQSRTSRFPWCVRHPVDVPVIPSLCLFLKNRACLACSCHFLLCCSCLSPGPKEKPRRWTSSARRQCSFLVSTCLVIQTLLSGEWC